MKKLLLGLPLFFMISFVNVTGADGQGRGKNPEMRIEQRVNDMKTQLNLSDEQVTKITSILKDARNQMIFAKASGVDAGTMRAKRQVINQNSRKQIKLVLTSEQMEKWKSIQKSKQRNKMATEPKN